MDSTSLTEDAVTPFDRCRRWGYWWMIPDTGELTRPVSCESIWCERCRLQLARKRIAPILHRAGESGHVRLLTLTKLPTAHDEPLRLDWARTRDQVRDFRRRVQADGYQFEWSWAVEPNPRGTGYHLHALCTGDYLPQRLLADRWGGRRVDIRLLRDHRGSYAHKRASAPGYAFKHSASSRRLTSHLALNGARVQHRSRAYLPCPAAEYVQTFMQQLNVGVPSVQVFVSASLAAPNRR